MSKQFTLLSRDQFREKVFYRDNHKCVVCKKPAADAHHIMERKLWDDGGYYLENGASLCEEHHIEAEKTTISCDELRSLIGITTFPIPSHLYHDQPYDKWGNPILPNKMRLKGELFGDISVQKILGEGNMLSMFVDHIKYPRTYHLPWSPGVTKNDRMLPNLSRFENKTIVVTEKLDGENTTMYTDYIHARSIEYESHPSRSWVKALHSRIGFNIPIGWRVCGENLYAKHSIKYDNLEDYFQVFSIWNDKNECLSWEDTVEWTNLLELKVVPVLYIGQWDEKLLRGLYETIVRDDPCEGYVVRIVDSFHYKDFRRCAGKYVRENHVQTHGHWMRTRLELNKLRD